MLFLFYDCDMNNFQTIILKIKAILSQKKQCKVHDKDVAKALGITPSTFASMKKRNRMPYRYILDFCVQHHINANTLLFQRPVNNFLERPATIRYYKDLRAGAGGGAEVFDENFEELGVQEFIALFITQLSEK